MELTSEQFSELPEFMKTQFEEFEGKYLSVDSLKLQKVKSTADTLDARAKEFETKYKNLETQLSEFEKNKALELQKARDEALEQALTKQETDEVKKIYQQKMDDLEARSFERGKMEAMQEFKAQSLSKDAEVLRKSIAADIAHDDSSRSALELLLASMIKPSDDSIGFFDAQGSALSVKDSKEFVSEVIKKNPIFKHLIKPDIVVSGAGLAGGGAAGFASKPLKDMSESERVDLKRTNPDLFKQLMNKRG